MRTTEFAPATPEAKEQQAPSSGYGPPTLAAPWKAGRLSGRDFVLQPDGTLRCPANQALSATEQRREADGSLRLVYAAKMSQCRPCLLREQGQWHGRATTKPRRVSLLLHPLQVGSAPLRWRDWSRRQHRRACMGLLRSQRVEVTLPQATSPESQSPEGILSRAQRAHYRLSWEERLARNARIPTTDRPTIKQIARPRNLRHFPRSADGVRRLWLPQDVLFSDGPTSPSGTLWPFFLASPLFLSSAALFAPSSAISASPPGHHVQLGMRFRCKDTTQGSLHLVAQFVGLVDQLKG